MSAIRAEIRVHGRVQGVAYRAAAARRAATLGLVGHARNLDDGSVEVVVEGDPERVDAMVAWCHDGPPLARVEGVRVERGPARGGLDGFTIG